MKFLKIFGISMSILFVILAIALIAVVINHKKQLKIEAREYLQPGRMVEVNGKKFHVYVEGEGDLTLVFMSGHGTNNPTLDFKPLWTRMVEDYRIAVVERSGYGWSEPSNSPRDIDTLLEETRQALNLAGVKSTYVLVPHSMSGLEAIYWTQKYPHEVKAIIGLDPCIPETYDILPEPEKGQLYAMYVISRTGLSRFMDDSEVENIFPLMKAEDLTEEEKQEYLATFYRSAFSKDMLREVNYLKENAETVADNAVPINTPMFFFISDGQEASVDGWKGTLVDYLAEISDGVYTQLATDHYLHYDKSEVIAEQSKAFLESIE